MRDRVLKTVNPVPKLARHSNLPLFANMPAKKKPRIEPNQTKLKFHLKGSTVISDSDDARDGPSRGVDGDGNPDTSVSGGSESETKLGKRSERKFIERWEKEFDWVRFDR